MNLDEFNGVQGLMRLETTLGLSHEGAELSRLGAIVTNVERRVAAWERMTPSALMREHAVLDALFAVTERVDVSAFVNGGELPNYWWSRLAIQLDGIGVYDRLLKQIHRETHALSAQEYLQEARSLGGIQAGVAAKARAASWHADCVNRAREMLDGGRAPRELTGILAIRFNKTPRRVRTALQAAGVLESRKRK